MKKIMAVLLAFVMVTAFVSCGQESNLQLCGINIGQYAQETDDGFVFTAGKSYISRQSTYTGEDRYIRGYASRGSIAVKEISDFFNGVKWGEKLDFNYDDICDQLYYYETGIKGLDEYNQNEGVTVIFYGDFTRAVSVNGDFNTLHKNISGTAFTVENPEYVKEFFSANNLYLPEDTIICGVDIAPWIVGSLGDFDIRREWPVSRTMMNNTLVAGNKYLNSDWKTVGNQYYAGVKLLSAVKTEPQPTEYDFLADELCYTVTMATYDSNYVGDSVFTYYISQNYDYIGVLKGHTTLKAYQQLDFPTEVYRITNQAEIAQLAQEYGVNMPTIAQRSPATGASGPCGVDISWWLDNFENAASMSKGRLHLKAVMNDGKYYEDDKRSIGGKGTDVVKMEGYLPALKSFSTTESIPFDNDYFEKDDYFYMLNFHLTDFTRENVLTYAPEEITFMFLNDFQYVVISDIPMSTFSCNTKYVISDIYKVTNPQQIKDCFVAEEIYIQ